MKKKENPVEVITMTGKASEKKKLGITTGDTTAGKREKKRKGRRHICKSLENHWYKANIPTH